METISQRMLEDLAKDHIFKINQDILSTTKAGVR